MADSPGNETVCLLGGYCNTAADNVQIYEKLKHPLDPKTIEERDSILASLPDDVKSRPGEDRSRPLVKIFQHRENNNKSYLNNRGGVGNWGSSRVGNSGNRQGGYRSGGGASDSDGNRGGRGGRGGQRGGRSGDRGQLHSCMHGTVKSLEERATS